jgi:hypothetical protein
MDGLEAVAVGVTHLVEGFGQVLQQVQAISNLDRVWGTVLGPVRIGSGSIAGDHADAGRGLSLAGEGLGLAIRQEGQRSLPFEIDPHGPIGLAFLVGQSSTPSTWGVGQAGRGRRRRSRSWVGRLMGRPNAQLNCTPAMPPAPWRHAPASGQVAVCAAPMGRPAVAAAR